MVDSEVVTDRRNPAKKLRSIGNPSGNKVWTGSVAAADERVLRSVKNHGAAPVVHVHSGRKTLRPVRKKTAVVPVEFNLRHRHLRHIVAGREDVLHMLRRRAGLAEKLGRRALYMNRVAEVQGLERSVEDVAGHVTESAGAEVPPASEVPRGVDGMVRTHRGRAYERIPVEG